MFKVGDRVILNKKELLKKYTDLSNCNINKIYTISAIFDAAGNYYAAFDEIIGGNNETYIKLIYIESATKMIRKQKLQKLNICSKKETK
jgi:hypothetical protein